jgi:hypothetical protein
MADYQEAPVTGTSYVRANSVLLENPKNGAKNIIFAEERWYDLGDGTSVTAQLGQLATPFDPAGEIVVLDPVTGVPTGATVTQGEVYALIYSFYIQEATKRDNQPKS